MTRMRSWLCTLVPVAAFGAALTVLNAPAARAQSDTSVTDAANFNSTYDSNTGGYTGGNGAYPSAPLTLLNGVFYGTASDGGTSEVGTLFSFNPSTSALTTLVNFGLLNSSTNQYNGETPAGALVYDPNLSTPVFFGTTEYGGSQGYYSTYGNIFSFDPVSGTLNSVSDFTGANGQFPLSGLTYDPVNGDYYGVTFNGGANANGDVYAFNPTTDVITDVADFGAAHTAGANIGEDPIAALTYDSANGAFYGVALEGGAHDGGDVFAFVPNATNPGATGTLADVGDFGVSTQGETGDNGDLPQGGLTLDTASGVFYGTADSGGAHSFGDVFSFTPNATSPTGTGTLADVGDFGVSIPGGGTNGENPSAALLYNAGEDEFYGTAQSGGAHGKGDVFVFVPATNTLADVGDFGVSVTSGGDNGENPSAGLTYDSGTGDYYGVAESGGANGIGDVFVFTPPVAASTSVTVTESASTLTTTQALTLTATVSPAAAAGSVEFLLTPTGTTAGGEITATVTGSSGTFSHVFPAGTLSPGGYTVSAAFAASNPSLYGPSIGSGADLTVTEAAPTATSLTVSAAPSSPTTAQTITLTADVTPTAAAGTVTFSLTPAGGSAITQTDTVTDGVATETFSAGSLTAGTYTLSAQFTPATPASYGSSTAPSGTLQVVTGTTTPPTPTALHTFPVSVSGIQMASFDEAYASFATAFYDQTAPTYFTWNGSAYPLTPADPARGQGFWLANTSAVTVYDTGTPSGGDAAGTVSVPLTPGWNLIGNPFSANLPVSGLSIGSLSGLSALSNSGLVYGTLYTWGAANTLAGGYTTVNGLSSSPDLTPFTGYWLYSYHTQTLTMAVGAVPPPPAP